jgi:hypothetical protein
MFYETQPDIFVTLKAGWQMDGAHCFGEDSHADVRKTMRRVVRCQCAQCIEELGRK